MNIKLAVHVLVASLLVSESFAGETNLTVALDGKIYSNVTFTSVSVSTASFRHSTGAGTVSLEKLSPELQKQLGYDPVKAKAYEAAKQQREQAMKAEAAEARNQIQATVQVNQIALTIRNNSDFDWTTQLQLLLDSKGFFPWSLDYPYIVKRGETIRIPLSSFTKGADRFNPSTMAVEGVTLSLEGHGSAGYRF